jgi:hypothetical protein
VVITMVLPDADPLHEDNVRPADRNGQAIPTHQTTSPKATMTQDVVASFVRIGLSLSVPKDERRNCSPRLTR